MSSADRDDAENFVVWEHPLDIQLMTQTVQVQEGGGEEGGHCGGTGLGAASIPPT